MPISYRCVCGREITTREDRAGKIEKCPECRMSVMVPEQPRPDHMKDRPLVPGKR